MPRRKSTLRKPKKKEPEAEEAEGQASSGQTEGEEELSLGSNQESNGESSQESNQESNQEIIQYDEDTRDYDMGIGGGDDALVEGADADADVKEGADAMVAENGVEVLDEELDDVRTTINADEDEEFVDANDADGDDVIDDELDEDVESVSASVSATPAKSPLNGEALSISPETMEVAEAQENTEPARQMVPPNPLSVPVRKEMTMEDSLVSLPRGRFEF